MSQNCCFQIKICGEKRLYIRFEELKLELLFFNNQLKKSNNKAFKNEEGWRNVDYDVFNSNDGECYIKLKLLKRQPKNSTINSLLNCLNETKELMPKFRNHLKNNCSDQEDNYSLVASLEDYINQIYKVRPDNDSKIYYRGIGRIVQNVVPSMCFNQSIRKYNTNGERLNLEKELFDSFLFRFEKELHNMCFLEQLAVMRHHGLPSRLMDVTSNPLVALYFACSEKDVSFATVFAINVARKNSITTLNNNFAPFGKYDKKYFDNNGTIYTPFHLKVSTDNERMIAQSGSFIVADDDYETTDEDKIYIKKKFIILCKNKDILKKLDALKINTANLFPDMDNYTKYLLSKKE